MKSNLEKLIILITIILAFVSVYTFISQITIGEKYFWDFTVYYNAAKTWFEGQDPYSLPMASIPEDDADLFFLYPAPTLYFFLPFTNFPLALAKDIWLVLSFLAFAAIIYLIKKNLHLAELDLSYSYIVLIMLIFFFSFPDFLGNGNIEIFLVLMAITGFYFILRQNYYAAACFFALASFFKFYYIFLGLSFLWGKRKYIAPFIILGLFVAFFYSTFYFFYPADFEKYIESVFSKNTGSYYSNLETHMANLSNPSLASVLLKVLLAGILISYSIFLFLDTNDRNPMDRIVFGTFALFLLTLRFNNYLLPLCLLSALYLFLKEYADRLRMFLKPFPIGIIHCAILFFSLSFILGYIVVYSGNILVIKIAYHSKSILFIAIFIPYVYDIIRNWRPFFPR